MPKKRRVSKLRAEFLGSAARRIFACYVQAANGHHDTAATQSQPASQPASQHGC